MKYLLAVVCLFIYACTDNPSNIVQTDKGAIEGYYNTDETIRIFKGIPYAAPPVGDLRWRAPQAATAWEGVRKATDFGPSPIQNKPEPFYCWTEEFIAKPEPLSEDCLYLNVWTSAKAKTEKQPVFVWIYGGGLSSGSSNCDIYDGEEMAKQGLVFVSINYRVGAIGFMAHPELSAASPSNTSGNYGFLDQIAALKWVKNNISSFGGDPNNVTIAGQSAGAFSVNTLIASPLAKQLFHKAILQSGGLLSNRLQQNLEQAEQTGQRLMEVAEVNSIEELRKMPAEEIQEISNDRSIGRFGVTLDDYVLPKDLMNHFEQGQHQQVPVMAGWVTGDGNFMGQSEMTVAEYEAEAETLYGEKAGDFLKIFPASTDQEVQQMKSKLVLINFAGMTPHLLSGFNPQPTFVYEFGHVPPDKPDFPNYGAFHTSEVPFTLHTLHTWQRPWRPIDKEIENMMSAYWVNFAKTGNPNGEGLPEWKAYEKATGHILTIDENTSSKEAYMKAALDFLEVNQN
jgi:para-nitrobenzyl esterase